MKRTPKKAAASAAKPPAKKTTRDARARVVPILDTLRKTYPAAKTALDHSSPLELLVATILSAQCTDERVNIVTGELFRKYRTAEDYAKASPRQFEREIRSTGFFRAKTKSILNCCKALVERHGGRVPESMEDLVGLPGVGRKTANVVLGSAFGKSEGIVVDTHVKRLAGRLGFTEKSDPEKIEQDLMEITPREYWIDLGTLLIWHGRRICQARKPKCEICPVADLCPSAQLYLTAKK